MSLRRRTFGNAAANIVGVGLTGAAQLATIPILTTVWGPERFGTWLMLATIPTWFALSDLGFGSVAMAEMIAANARHDRDRAVSAFQSVLLLTAIVSTAAVLLAVPLLFAAHLPLVPGWVALHGPVMFVLVGYAAAAVISRLVLTALRSSGFYASSTVVYEIGSCCESMAMLAAAAWGLGFFGCAVVLLLCRSAIVLMLALLLARRVPELRIGLARASVSELRRMLPAAIATTAFPTAFAVNIQGMTLVTGALLSPLAVAVLEPVRTASRVAIQITGAMNRATMPEFATAAARHDSTALRKILAINGGIVVVFMLPGSIAFALLGGTFVGAWTGGRVVPGADFVGLMAAAMFVHGLWHFAANLLLSVNAHLGFARVLIASAIVSVAAAAPAASCFGLDGIAATILASEVMCLAGVCHAGLRSGLGAIRAPARIASAT
ncbi:lipopolysaccharide biosynthesis protein [Rhodoplanes roseus]|uniref:Polysaccharide biosynthesis protein n=1 Tax=Rhodoplanes roseus TaxID=29409 RepID=A0A327L234_9BRAD|nr:hypothetical protein [Rhodoplanes roseus]RAI45009.1 hypothetical protein CH341_06240 [Rhodoplanes roseus]